MPMALMRSKLAFVFASFLFCCQVCATYTSYCSNSYFSTQSGVIIRTADAVASGATVLTTFHITSEEICKQACCKLHACTVAVFETKSKNLCYLFDCGKDASLCSFDPHDRYTVSIKTRKAHSQDKSGLPVRDITPTPVATVPLITKNTWPQSRHAAAAAVGGAQPRSQCRYPEAQFACRDAAKSPSCVAIYDRCDGVPQCGDSSDEADCPAAATAATAVPKPFVHTGQVSEHQMQTSLNPPPRVLASTDSDDDVTNSLWDSRLGLGGVPSPSNSMYNPDKIDQLAEEEVDEEAGSSPGRPSPSSRSPVAGSQAHQRAAAGVIEFAAPTEASLAELYQRSRATVIGLGVALAVTLLAIVVLGCRLRQLRARATSVGGGKLRSRALDDEDYLINGMYL